MKYKTAIVTGASRGLGKAIARSLLDAGLNVMLASRSEPELKAITDSSAKSANGRIAYTVTDLTSPASINALIENTHRCFGTIDVLVNNAGVGHYKPLPEWSEQEIIDTVAVNLTAPMLCSRAVLRDMLPQQCGFIVNIASDLGRRYLPNMAPYVGTKFGLLGFTGSMLREVNHQGIKACTVLPGLIDTNFDNSHEGTRHEAVALRPEVIARLIVDMLQQPELVIVDEITIHPTGQDF